MRAVAKQEQFELPIGAEAALYLRSDRPQSHFAVLQRDPARKAIATEAREQIVLKQCLIDLLRKTSPNGEYLLEQIEEMKVLRKKAWDLRQTCYPVADMPQVLKGLPTDRDTYISQSLFNPFGNGFMTRRRVTFSCSSVLFIDLDFYKAGVWTLNQAIAKVLYLLEERGWPPPSIIVYSGRGIYLKWLFTTPLPRPALVRWEAAERALVNFFKAEPDLGVDETVKDASRVLRMEHTTNEKSQQTVEILYMTPGVDGKPLLYDFEYLFEYFLPYTRDQIKVFQENDLRREQENAAFKQSLIEQWKTGKPALTLAYKGEPTGLKRLSGRQLAWDRSNDFEDLAKMRGWDKNGIDHGFRSRFILYYVNFQALSGDLTPTEFWGETTTAIQKYAPNLLRNRDKSVFAPLLSKLHDFINKKEIEFNGKMYPALYTPKNGTLIEMFQITGDEERQLKTIVSEGEARRRHAERSRKKREAAGAKSTEAHLSDKEAKRASGRLMHAEGANWQEVADKLGYKTAKSAQISCMKK